MEASLSSLIAFVGFLIVFSMLIQSLQEALKNLFKLRTGVWERFFISLYRTEFQSQGARALEPTPFLQRVRKGDFLGEFEHRLKRIQTVVSKTDTLITEIRLGLNQIIAAEKTGTPADPHILDTLVENAAQVAALKLDAMLKIYNKSKNGAVRSGLEEFRTLAARLEAFQETQKGDGMALCTELMAVTTQLKNNIAPYRVQIENKADAWLVQLEGEYKKNMLKWTLVISLFAVVLLNADACRIYTHFALNPSARQTMETAAAAVTEFSQAGGGDLIAIDKEITAGNLALARDMAAGAARNLADAFDTLKNLELQKEAQALASAIQALDLSVPDRDAALLKEKIGALGLLFFKQQQLNIRQHTQSLASAGLPLGWTEDLNTFPTGENAGKQGLLWIVKKICGLGLTLFLVSFGAPFWKDIMGALVGFRELVKSPQKNP